MAVARLGRPQTLAHLLRQAHMVAQWREAALGALPMIIAAVLIGPRLWQWAPAAAAAAVLIVGMTLYGLWRGRPAWFYPWAGLALTLPLIAGYLAFLLLKRGPGLGDGAALSTAAFGFGVLYFPVGVLVVSGAVLVAVRRDWLDASVLLSPLPVALVWIISVHRAGGILDADDSLAGTSQILAGACLCMATAIVVMMRARTRALKVAVLVSVAVALIAVGDLAASPSATFVVTAARSAVLVGFLLSPALVARRLGSIR
jgi:hypothetical protein